MYAQYFTPKRYKNFCFFLIVFKALFIYSFIYWKRGREGEREGEKNQCVIASHTCLNWRPNLQPRHVPWLGIELVTFCFAGQCPTNWATLVRAKALYAFLRLNHLFNYSLHSALFCISFRCTALWPDNHVLYKVFPTRNSISSTHLALYIVITILLTIFPMLYLMSPLNLYFLTVKSLRIPFHISPGNLPMAIPREWITSATCSC